MEPRTCQLLRAEQLKIKSCWRLPSRDSQALNCLKLWESRSAMVNEKPFSGIDLYSFITWMLMVLWCWPHRMPTDVRGKELSNRDHDRLLESQLLQSGAECIFIHWIMEFSCWKQFLLCECRLRRRWALLFPRFRGQTAVNVVQLITVVYGTLVPHTPAMSSLVHVETKLSLYIILNAVPNSGLSTIRQTYWGSSCAGTFWGPVVPRVPAPWCVLLVLVVRHP